MRQRSRRLLWFVGIAAASLVFWGVTAFAFREFIFFVLEH